MRTLVAYFSHAGENYGVGNIAKGNTEAVAELVAAKTGGDLFRIRTVKEYPQDYKGCTGQAKEEQRKKARPELSGPLPDIGDYDTVFLGYPNWWGDLPMAVYTFLEAMDFPGKTIVPFCTHEGSGLSSTAETIRRLCPGSKVLDGFEVRGRLCQGPPKKIEAAVEAGLAKLS